MGQIDKIKYFACDIPEVVKMYHYAGDFEGEIRAIEKFLGRDNIPSVLKERLLLQKLTAEVLLNDYPLSDEEFIKVLNERQSDRVLTLEDADAIADFQNADYIIVNGQRKWQYQQVKNVICQHEDFFREMTPCETFDNAITDKMEERGEMVCHFRCREECELLPHAVKEGEIVRIWLPYPVENETQDASKIKMLSASHPYKITGDTLRMIYIETEAHLYDKYIFEFEYENRAKFHDPIKVRNSKVSEYVKDENYVKYTSEQYPQTVFTPFLKELAAEITSGFNTPAEKAYAIYTWITSHIKYSYLRDYLIIPNIPEYVAINGYGDCGAMVLLFIALCRICGIPARWQSGNGVSPGHMGSHDWCRFYLPEFGWLYCDPSYGVSAYKYGNEKRRLHYFCNIDAFRMVACDDFLVDLVPSKKCVRMDPYDNQSGEAEYQDGSMNIFYGDGRFSKECVEAFFD